MPYIPRPALPGDDPNRPPSQAVVRKPPNIDVGAPLPPPTEQDLAAQPTTEHYEPQGAQPQLRADPTLVTKVMALCSEALPGSREVYRDRSGSIHLVVGGADEPLYIQVLHRGMCTLAPLSEMLQGRVEAWLESVVSVPPPTLVPRGTPEPQDPPPPPPAPEGETEEDRKRRVKREQMRRYREKKKAQSSKP